MGSIIHAGYRHGWDRTDLVSYIARMDEETQSSYDNAGFGQGVKPGAKPAVIVVDMCRAYFEAGSPLHLDRPEVIDAAAALVAAARSSAVPVYWTRVEFPLDGDRGVWYDKIPVLSCFDAGNPLADWIPGLVPAAGEVVVTKQHASAFFGTDLAGLLRADSVDTTLICGVSTSGCVRASATDASAHGFIPFVVSDAVGDRTAAVHDANLFDLNAKYADVIDLSQATQLLSSR